MRHDTDYYLPRHYKLLERLNGSGHTIKKLYEVSRHIVDGPFGSAIKADDYVEIGVPFIRVADVTHGDGTLNTKDMIYISEGAHQAIKRSTAVPGDVVIAKTGATMGAASVVPPTIPEANIRGDLALVGKLKSWVDADYLSAFINTDIGYKLFWRLNSGSTRGRVVISNLKKFPIIWPEAVIRQRIVEMVEEGRRQKNKRLAEANALLASIDDYLLSELGIVLPAEPENTIGNRMFRVSMHDVQQRHDPNFFGRKYVHLTEAITARPYKLLRQICTFSSEAWDQKTGYEDTFPYLEISAIDLKTGDVTEISETPIEEAPSRARMVARPNDILVSTTRPSRGAITLVPEGQAPFIASTGFAVIRVVDSNLIDREYLYHVLRSKLGLTQMEQRSSGGNYPAITLSELKRIDIPLPDLKIQSRIVAEIQDRKSAALSMRNAANAELEKAKREIEAILLGDAA